jgi:hypothetical protein
MGLRGKFKTTSKNAQASQAYAPNNEAIVRYQQALVQEHGGETEEVGRLVRAFDAELKAKASK